jgi:hypothetical protein
VFGVEQGVGWGNLAAVSEPLFAAAPTLTHRLGRAWFFDSTATVVTQLTCDEVTLEAAKFLAETFDRAVRARYVNQGRSVHSINDWRACMKYTIEARDLLLQWGRESAGHTTDSVIAISPHASPFFNIALQTGAFVLRGLRMKVQVVDELGPIVQQLAAEAPVPPL